MGELLTLTDATLNEALDGKKPALLLFTNGDGLRGDFKVAFKKLADENNTYVFGQIDPTANPEAAERFKIGSKPTLIGYAGGAEIVRRVRPWGSDLPLAVELMEQSQPEPVVEAEADTETNEEQNMNEDTKKEAVAVLDKPVNVTDATFEQEVLDSDVPVLVDFWAEWCGPCRMVAPILEKMAGEFAGQIKIAKVDVDSNPGLSQMFRITSIPTLMIVKNRTIIFSQPGALPEPTTRDLIQQAITIEVPEREPEGEAEAETEAETENAGD